MAQAQNSGTVDSLKSDEFACGFGEGIAFGSQRNLRSCERLAVLHPRWGPTYPSLELNFGFKRCRINVRLKINSRKG